MPARRRAVRSAFQANAIRQPRGAQLFVSRRGVAMPMARRTTRPPQVIPLLPERGSAPLDGPCRVMAGAPTGRFPRAPWSRAALDSRPPGRSAAMRGGKTGTRAVQTRRSRSIPCRLRPGEPLASVRQGRAPGTGPRTRASPRACRAEGPGSGLRLAEERGHGAPIRTTHPHRHRPGAEHDASRDQPVTQPVDGTAPRGCAGPCPRWNEGCWVEGAKS
jgi:hypothetical protein